MTSFGRERTRLVTSWVTTAFLQRSTMWTATAGETAQAVWTALPQGSCEERRGEEKESIICEAVETKKWRCDKTHRRAIRSLRVVPTRDDLSERVLPDRKTGNLVLDQELEEVKSLAVQLLVLSKGPAA